MQVQRFPGTRYQGSKRKLLPWLYRALERLDFDTALDAFSGTASVSYLLKAMGKQVTANDYLRCNQSVARALVVNSDEQLSLARLEKLSRKCPDVVYEHHIESLFRDVFYLPEENRWLDVVAQNISRMSPGGQRCLAQFALFQACIAKRPYNLFHRANLYMRLADVQRSFGNKATWDRSFERHWQAALTEANRAVFDNGRRHQAWCKDVAELPGGYDLVYLDPPYINGRGQGVDYLDFYHFLEGLTEYAGWPERVCRDYKHRPYPRRRNPWQDPKRFCGALSQLLEVHRAATIVISYRDNGVPTVEELCALLRHHGRRPARSLAKSYQYVLSRQAGREVLLVSEPS